MVEKIIILCVLALWAVAMIRNVVAFKNRTIIINAIYRYRLRMISIGVRVFNVSFDDMEPYGKTMLRFWVYQDSSAG